MSVFKANGTGTGAIATSMAVPTGDTYRLISVSLNLNVAPTTAESFTITLDTNAGAAYDVLLYSVDPSVTSVTDIFWYPDETVLLEGGDEIDVAYPNSDNVTYGVQITVEAV